MQPSAEETPPWWVWPTVLSLDAPAVVLLWQRLLASCASVRLGAPEAVVLGCSVWLSYSADRWIEGWRLDPENIRTHRHQFHRRWRWPLAGVWLAVLILDIAVAARGLGPAQFRSGCLLLVPVAAYLLSHQLLHRRSRWRVPKEACVAALLGAGAAVFIVASPGLRAAALVAPLALFVLLCFSNCALISVWEDEVDRSHGETSLAQQFGLTARVAGALPWVLSAAGLGIAAAGGDASRTAGACGAASGALLGCVSLLERRLGRVRARVLADVALMTPVVPLILGRLP